MKKRTFIMVLGLLIAIVPILGLPPSWKSAIIIILGLVVALLAATRKGSSAMKTGATRESDEGNAAVAPAVKKPRRPRTVKVAVSTTPSGEAKPEFKPEPEEESSLEKVPEESGVVPGQIPVPEDVEKDKDE